MRIVLKPGRIEKEIIKYEKNENIKLTDEEKKIYKYAWICGYAQGCKERFEK